MKYRYVDIYTYTHRDSLKYYLAGRGDIAGGDPPLGAVEGPDTDGLDVQADCFIRARVTVTALFSLRRRGEGNDFRKFDDGLDPFPPFPSGEVERTTRIGLGLLWEIRGGSSLEAVVEHSVVDNRNLTSGARRRGHGAARVARVGSVNGADVRAEPGRNAVIKRLLSTVEIVRPHNMVAAGACVYSAYFLSGGREIGPAFWPVVFTALVAGLGNLVNDVFDTGHRPREQAAPPDSLADGSRLRTFSASTLWGTVLVTAAMVGASAGRVFALTLAWEALLFFYAARVKRTPLVGNVVIAAVCASAFLVGALVTGASTACSSFPPRSRSSW